MKIAIIGCGSLGLLWGARLAQTGHELTLITRTQEQQQSINDQGIQIEWLDGKAQTIPVCAKWVQDCFPSSFDFILVTVKQVHLAEVIPVLQQITHPATRLLFWQNGLGHEKQIARLKNRPWTYAAITTEGARKISDHRVKHTGTGEIAIGAFPDFLPTDPILEKWIAELIDRFGFQINLDGQIAKKMWEKLAINCAINPLTALEQIRNGELLKPTYTWIMKQICAEVVAVANRKGFSFELSNILYKVTSVCQQTAQNISSMLQDMQKGVQTEIDYLNGAVVKYGKEEKVPTPINEKLVKQVHQKEEQQMSKKRRE
ncbi:ketopantoate reductase family protein [Thermoflavimicrobium dichotomicum]|uniref:2-dehydropantoate 2-reductase n=1 Tax=Thermoflavimicrobium dichotomicum TaxID=46223 RepID=A0A1I3N7J9_9BACL|nr:2-dehydropantoate 2-reductase [Thermoflavimicrobium dichotomicum]SFJ05030.1 2-dehydropantoate 2-reductase [Thermoflavimicrobium dichotomicum]